MDNNSGNGFYENEDPSNSNSLMSGIRAPDQSQAESPSESGFFNGGGSSALSKHRRIQQSSGPSFNPNAIFAPNEEIAGSEGDNNLNEFSPDQQLELDYGLQSYSQADQDQNVLQAEGDESLQSVQENPDYGCQSSEQQPHLTSINLVRDTEHSYNENGPGVYGLGENQFKMLQRKQAKQKVTESSGPVKTSISQTDDQELNYQAEVQLKTRNSVLNDQKKNQMIKLSQHLYNQEHNTLQNFLEPQHTISLTELSDTNNLAKIFQNKQTSSSIPARGVSGTGGDLAEFLKMNKVQLNDTSEADRSELVKQPILLVNLKAENQHLKQKIKSLEEENQEQKSHIQQLRTKKEQLHTKLEAKDKSITKLRNQLKLLKDDIQLVNESLNQCKRSARFIRTEDEHLQELSAEMMVLLDDCEQKTMVKEDEKGNMSIGALTFVEEDIRLSETMNSGYKVSADEIIQDIKISLEAKIASLSVVSGQLAHAMSTGQFNQMELIPKLSAGTLHPPGYSNKKVNKTIAPVMAASHSFKKVVVTESEEGGNEPDEEDDSMCNVSDEEAPAVTRVKNESRRSLKEAIALNQMLSGSTLQGIPSSAQLIQNTDGQVESLKRELRLFVEKCSSITTASQNAQLESSQRSRQRDEEIIDLEWKLSQSNKQNDLLLQENQVLTSDCHNLISKNQYSSQQVNDAKEFKKHSEKTINALRSELKHSAQKLQLARQEYSKIIQLHGKDQHMIREASEEGKHQLSMKLKQVEKELQDAEQLVNQQAAEIQTLKRKINFDSAEFKEKESSTTKKNEILYSQNQELRQQVAHLEQIKGEVEKLRAESQEFEKERQMLNVKITKERQKRTLFENIQKQDAGVTAQTLIDYLSYIFGKRKNMEPERFRSIHDLFSEKQIRLIELYETKINTVNQMNANMFAQLKEFLLELLTVHEGNPTRLKELQQHDKIISQFQLEEESKQSIFDWISNFKDYEIRESLKTQIQELEQTLDQRDKEIITLQLKIEDLEVMIGAGTDDNLSNYQSGLSSQQSHHEKLQIQQKKKARLQKETKAAQENEEVQQQLKKDSISTQEGIYNNMVQRQLIEREQETITLIEELKEALKMKDAELFDLQRDLEEQHRVMLKQQMSTDSASHLQIINCQATLMEELLRQQRQLNSANSSRQNLQRS